MKDIVVTGGLDSVSGYSSAGREFVKALSLKSNVYVRNMRIHGDHPIVWEDRVFDTIYGKKLDAGVRPAHQMFWGVPDLIPQDMFVKGNQLMVSWECDMIPKKWETMLNEHEFEIFTPSSQSKSSFKNVVGSSVNVLPHGYNPDVIKPLSTTLDYKTRFLIVGVPVERKAILENILHAAVAAAGTNCEIIYKCNLDADTANMLKRVITKHLVASNIENPAKITILNKVFTPEEMNYLYNKCDALISLSRGEAFNLPMFNAAVLGKPVFSTSMNGCVDWFNKDYPFIPSSAKLTHDSNPNSYYSSSHGLKWWEPDFKAAVNAIREYIYKPDEFNAIAQDNSSSLEFLTWDYVVDLYLSML
jgi:glycosyltransferase involved in cell wall biosynthesis